MVDGPTSLFLYIHSRQIKVKAQKGKKNQSCYNVRKQKQQNQQSSLCLGHEDAHTNVLENIYT